MANEPARNRPTGLLRLFFKAPALLYRLGLGGQGTLGKKIILLTTIGRKSGQRRQTALNYGQEGSTVYVLAGFGSRSDWYRNLLANPEVEVQIGKHHYAAKARGVTDPAEARRAVALVQQSDHGPPPFVRPILKRLMGLDYDAEAAWAFAHPEQVLAVALEISIENGV